jgi:hypothetical protein
LQGVTVADGIGCAQVKIADVALAPPICVSSEFVIEP